MRNHLQQARHYLNARKEHPAWLLLASLSGPILLSCLEHLLAQSREGIEQEATILELAGILRTFHESGDITLSSEDYQAEARRELRKWIKRGLVIEREGLIIATDALESAFAFVSSLNNRLMTTTASRLSIVQREIENLETHLNPDPKQRADKIQRQIQQLEKELERAKRGEVTVLNDQQAMERIQEIYNLATSLRADFRRVEDSYREADQRLRKSIISEQSHRGDIVDKLLDTHDALLKTDEGRVFDSFQKQLIRSSELEEMKVRLRAIVNHKATPKALNLKQQSNLRWLVMRLVAESEIVIRARAKSERDVKGFLKTGLAAEHHRVGELLNDIFAEAMEIDWSKQATRRLPSPLPAVGIANNSFPLVERFRFKIINPKSEAELDLREQQGQLDDIDESFWESFNDLDREALLKQTMELLQQNETDMTVGQIAEAIPVSHDLEALAFWLGIALDTNQTFVGTTETADLKNDDKTVRFTLPRVELNAAALNKASADE